MAIITEVQDGKQPDGKQPDGKYVTIDKHCMLCGDKRPITFKAEEFVAWQEGELIQNACPDMSIDDREMMISNMCPKCWEEALS